MSVGAHVHHFDERADAALERVRGRSRVVDRVFLTASELGDFSLIWQLVNLARGLIPATLPKLAGLRRLVNERGLPCDLEVDGGIGPQTIALVAQAGANLAVAGSAVFNQTRTIRENIEQLKDSS